jgi:hypothetical protein
MSKTLENNIRPTNTDINNGIVYNSYFINDTEEYNNIVQKITTLDNEIDLLEDKRSNLSKYIRSKLNIKCNYNQHLDIAECKEYIEFEKLMDIKEIELDHLIEQRQKLSKNNYNSYKDNLIKAYGNNKYIIIFTLINNDTTFTEVTVYNKEYDNELYNDTYNKICKLEYEYKYADNKYILLDEVIRLDNKVILSIIRRYDKKDYKIYNRVYLSDDYIIESYINIRSNFSILIEHLKGNTFNTTYTNYALGTHVDEITRDAQEYIDKVNKIIDYDNMKLIAV